jgi:site-specific DNA recombinase
VFRAAGLMRVSSQPQEAMQGFEIQRTAVDEYAERLGVNVKEYYRDVVTGTTATRHELDRLLRASGDYDLVIIPRVDRHARDIFVGPEVVRELMESGLEVHFTDIGKFDPLDPGSVYMYSMMLANAHVDHKKITENLRRGKVEKVKKGQVIGPLRTYGLRGNPDEAKWVRQMYEWNLSRGYHSIATRLNELGVPTPGSAALWRASTVQQILTNPVYKGEWNYGRTLRCSRCGRTRKMKGYTYRVHRPPDMMCRCGSEMTLERYTVALEPLVDPALWNRANDAARMRFRERSRPGTRTDRFPLQGHIFCGYCGGAMSGHKPSNRQSAYYFCRATLQSTVAKTCDHRKYHVAKHIDDSVMNRLREYMLDDDELRDSLKLPEPERPDTDRLKASLEAERDNLLRLALKGIITDGELARERERISAALEELSRPLEPTTPNPDDIRAWRERVKAAMDADLHQLVTIADCLILVFRDRLEVEVR